MSCASKEEQKSDMYEVKHVTQIIYEWEYELELWEM